MLPTAELAVPTAEDLELVELAREVIDANTDAGPDEDGAHTMGAAVRDADGWLCQPNWDPPGQSKRDPESDHHE
ncbi:hypothetical protein RCH22_000517 [Cryobacterium psychrotolerans]|nr:hypothetical protein [Cryobacterium psychrotolerans]